MPTPQDESSEHKLPSSQRLSTQSPAIARPVPQSASGRLPTPPSAIDLTQHFRAPDGTPLTVQFDATGQYVLSAEGVGKDGLKRRLVLPPAPRHDVLVFSKENQPDLTLSLIITNLPNANIAIPQVQVEAGHRRAIFEPMRE